MSNTRDDRFAANEGEIHIDDELSDIGGYTFPKTTAQARDWKPYVTWRALSRRVLVVARTRVEGKWSAYCDAVPGICHEDETAEVLRTGTKLSESVARAMFTQLKDVPYAP